MVNVYIYLDTLIRIDYRLLQSHCPRIGVSQGQFFDQHLKFIRLNDVCVDLPTLDIPTPLLCT